MRSRRIVRLQALVHGESQCLKRRPPRVPEDHRMNLYHDTFRGRLRWYVKVSNTGRRIDITEEYSTDERSDFH